jgi:hypothetical protein
MLINDRRARGLIRRAPTDYDYRGFGSIQLDALAMALIDVAARERSYVNLAAHLTVIETARRRSAT